MKTEKPQIKLVRVRNHQKDQWNDGSPCLDVFRWSQKTFLDESMNQTTYWTLQFIRSGISRGLQKSNIFFYIIL